MDEPDNDVSQVTLPFGPCMNPRCPQHLNVDPDDLQCDGRGAKLGPHSRFHPQCMAPEQKGVSSDELAEARSYGATDASDKAGKHDAPPRANNLRWRRITNLQLRTVMAVILMRENAVACPRCYTFFENLTRATFPAERRTSIARQHALDIISGNMPLLLEYTSDRTLSAIASVATGRPTSPSEPARSG